MCSNRRKVLTLCPHNNNIVHIRYAYFFFRRMIGKCAVWYAFSLAESFDLMTTQWSIGYAHWFSYAHWEMCRWIRVLIGWKFGANDETMVDKGARFKWFLWATNSDVLCFSFDLAFGVQLLLLPCFRNFLQLNYPIRSIILFSSKLAISDQVIESHLTLLKTIQSYWIQSN